ncbi:hypothetical protein EIN_487300 [Entamoeba invadens IP1]|uniref:MI domain-containing protein n=1 Tax=Entamoeba invadens IP1 TaxID=370355 RepID=A0A0A1UAS2_ENTIV|nr:hypothetical protein EIN_487300 [Entamoeba invadens IP1]ELP89248.1 hypothetical protein EIN_487300 [Entamoeba invadens IP1]|eukprot:XP_004256019.1 hypothetical protein EIN_487300 [Entamoeba invadens IP1]
MTTLCGTKAHTRLEKVRAKRRKDYDTAEGLYDFLRNAIDQKVSDDQYENVVMMEVQKIDTEKKEVVDIILSIVMGFVVDEESADKLVDFGFVKKVGKMIFLTPQIQEKIVSILTLACRSEKFSKEVLEKKVQKKIISSFDFHSSVFNYQLCSEFCKVLLSHKNLLNQSQIDEVRNFYLKAICSKSTSVVQDGLFNFYYFTTNLLFTLVPTDVFLKRISQLTHHKNKALSTLALNFSGFYQIEY